jgi:DNA-binding NarL/FixJ family response regulator
MGLSSKDIAEKLVLSENTIKSHRRNVLRKLEVKNMIQAVGMLEKLF